MSRQHYVDKAFRKDALDLIYRMNTIIADYVAQDYRLTVRQLYYQLVARDIVENTEQSYKRITGIVNDAKMAGLMDWEAIEDRTREFLRRNQWDSGAQVLGAVARQYHEDVWDNQPTRLFAIVEKEALAGVLDRACREYSIPLLAARGYPSGTVLREFAQSDLLTSLQHGQNIHIIHFGDHDPSGMDMSRDLEDRLRLFADATADYGCDDHWERFTFERVALNMDQIEELRPPKNPAKSTDARFADYRRRFGNASWELDALPPAYLANLIKLSAEDIIDEDRWEERSARIEVVRTELNIVSTDFSKKGL